ncbi:MAG: Stp1/IreP family PP2C-type Ser/Thr phosphatase [Halobacteriales archaeon]
MPVHATTDVGRIRDVNEDSVCHESFEKTELLAVADGMGGHSAGDIASQTALSALTESVTEAMESGETDGRSILATAIERANDVVRSAATGDPAKSNMGTTLVAALVGDGGVMIGNVGDSRAYRISQDRIEQVTVDQSLIQELVEQGLITEEEARTHPQRNVVSQALGTEESVDPDFYRISIEGATLLLCSDVLTDEVNDETVHEIVTSGRSLKGVGSALIKRAKANGGSDNISVVLYRG